MAVFRVMITGEKIIMKTDAGDESCGFVKNEYVWADTAESAVEKAKEKILARVAEKPGVTLLADSPLQLVVDEVEKGFPIWKLASSESFIFFDIEHDTQ